MNQGKFQDSEIPLSPPPVLQIASCQSAKVKKVKKGQNEDGVRRGKKRGRGNDADFKPGESRR
jgi:hypothetical protein